MTSAFALSTPPLISVLLENKTIPDLDEAQQFDVTDYLFKRASAALRIAVAEIAYRNQTHSNALDLFLACTMPLAEKYANRKARDLFVNPSDWQLECLYNGAVVSVLRMYELHKPLRDVPDGFRRYLLSTLATGALRHYFKRDEYWRVQGVKNVDGVLSRRNMEHNAEQDVITRELLEQVTHYPLLNRALSRTMECIVTLGPEGALKECDPPHSDPNKRAPRRYNMPVLDIPAIAKAKGVKVETIYSQMKMARHVLRMAFNGDGSLFMSQ
jgi:hypothetical protein